MRVTRLVCIFRSQGMQWPLRENDEVRVETQEGTLGVLSGEAIRHLVQHHLVAVALQEFLRQDVGRRLLDDPVVSLLALNRAPVEMRAKLRRQRRARAKPTAPSAPRSA